MAEISAVAVMKLRKMSGQGMMDCKKALQDTEGDLEKAMELLRKKGLTTLAKRSERETSQGRVVYKITDDGKTGIMATLCCETDFVAKSDDFATTAERLCEYAMACDADEGAYNIMKTSLDGKTFEELITHSVSKTGEKTEVGDYARFKVGNSGLINCYIHFNNKVGSMLLIKTDSEAVAGADAVKQVAGDIAMHITAIKPLALDKNSIDPKVIEQEKAIYTEQVKNKPANIIEKIVEGKMNKFFAENCLLQQPFVKDDSQTVEKVLSEAAKQAGGQAMITKFVRFEVGQ